MKRITILSLLMVLFMVGTGVSLAQEGKCTVIGECTLGADGKLNCSLELAGDCTLPAESECTLSADGVLECTPIIEEEEAPPEGEGPPEVAEPAFEGGEVVTLDDGTQEYEFYYTPGASAGSPEFQDKKRQAVAAAAREFVTLDPRPAHMAVIPLDEAGNVIEADRVFIWGDDVPALVGMDASAIMVPETGKAVLFLENWIGDIMQTDVGSQQIEVPIKQGEEPGRIFVSLDPGHYAMKSYAYFQHLETEIEFDLEAGEIFVWAMAIVGY